MVDAWSKCTDQIAKEMMDRISASQNDPETGRERPINSIYMMSHSGARGSPTQMKQLAGMRGLMTKPSGEIIETPIISNFKEGLSVLEYFNSTHGARKGLADTALKTANSGYLTRRLVDVAQDCIITEVDCGTDRGLNVQAVVDAGTVIVSLAARVLGRTAAEDVIHPVTREVIVATGELIEEAHVEAIDKAAGPGGSHPLGADLRDRDERVCQVLRARSGSRHDRQYRRGCRRHCRPVDRRAGHAAHDAHVPHRRRRRRRSTSRSSIRTSMARCSSRTGTWCKDSQGRLIAMGRAMSVVIVDQGGKELASHKIVYGARLLVDEGDEVKRGTRIAQWDPYTRPVLTEVDGVVDFEDMVDGLSVKRADRRDEGHDEPRRHRLARHSARHRTEAGRRGQGQQGRKPIKLQRGGDARYLLPVEAVLSVDSGTEVKAGDVLARMPMASAKSGDITGGLPRVAELFEARRPKDHAIIAEVSGTVEFGKDYKNKQRIAIKPDDESQDAGRVSDPARQEPRGTARRSRREGRFRLRRPSGAARHPGDQGRRGTGRTT